ncbi:MAG: caspase family protein [Longimicrobiales bacterium]|nr:caspase family protein [Longimicrobiales bacterium]
MTPSTMHRATAVFVLAAALAAAAARVPVTAQEIRFESELPRTLVFVPEAGGSGVAASGVGSFLIEAGFPLVDPALAHTAAQRELVQAALQGDEGAAVRLGRDFGAQILILGQADWGTSPDPISGTLVTGTSDVRLRALRLDEGAVVATAEGAGREIEATDQAARNGAIRAAVDEVIEETGFLGAIVNDWEANAWTGRGYFEPDPGSVESAVRRADGIGPGIAILGTRVRPAEGTDLTTRGIGVVRRSEAREADGVANVVEIEGVVVGRDVAVTVEGEPASLEPVRAVEAQRLGIDEGPASRFVARTTLSLDRDSVEIVARDGAGNTRTAFASPRIDERWAVIIGIGDYHDGLIPDLDFAAADARAVHDFLRSDAAGPFEEDHVLLLTDEQATGRAMREAMFVFLQQADWDDLVVIYFAGHGAPDPNRPDNLYLFPVDAEIGSLASTGFPMWDVKTALRRQIAAERVVVIADACHSAGTAEDADTGNPIGGAFDDLFTPSRRLTLTAADVNELSYEDARWGGGHGVFTWHILQGLQGDADADGDGIVTFVEVASFVKTGVGHATDGRQNPQHSGLGDVPLAVAGAGGRGEDAGDR